jgi:NADH:ubiquinone oxidoreductase subunit 4 (subunit M)
MRSSGILWRAATFALLGFSLATNISFVSIDWLPSKDHRTYITLSCLPLIAIALTAVVSDKGMKPACFSAGIVFTIGFVVLSTLVDRRDRLSGLFMPLVALPLQGLTALFCIGYSIDRVRRRATKKSR